MTRIRYEDNLTPFLAGLLTGLKLLGVIHWSWWAVLAPLWISLLVVIALLAFVGAQTLGESFRAHRR
jgi:hypothetical protein